MSVQNDNTLVTKGDLKTLYSDKIAPYLGGGINYYYTDRSGQELKCGDYNIQGNPTIPVNTSQNTHLNLSARGGTHPSDFLIKDGNIVIPEGTTVTIASNMVVNNNDNTSETNSLFMIYDYKNSANIGYASAVYHGNGVARTGSYTYNFTAPEGGAEIGIKCTYNAVASRKIGAESGLTITEIGRVVDPVKYVSNNSDLQETPVGNIISYMGNNVPKHYLACDGQTYSIGTYPELEAFIINEFGSINYFGGNGTTNWAVPDLRGEFLRGTGTTPYTDGGDGGAVGTHQAPTGINPGWTNNTTGGWSLPVAPSSTYSSIIVDNGDKYVNTGTRKSIIASTELKEKADTGSNAGYWTFRPTNTAVKYCIKYENTYHAFFSNAAYKVEASFGLNYNSTLQSYVSYAMSYITGDSSLMDENYFIAPVDGWYMVSFKSNQISYTKPAVQYLQINDVSANAFTDATGSGTSHSNFGVNMTHTIYLSKGDKVNYRVWTNGNTISLPSVRRASFCLLTSNYNPTIVSADSVYSENEQMVGYWKDGKPLYQKTLFSNTGSGVTNVDVTNLNIDKCIDVEGFVLQLTGNAYNCAPIAYISENGDWSTSAYYSKVNEYIGIRCKNYVNSDIYITIRYTKTTDTASSLQVENSLLLNRPDLWTPGTEYHFGGGLYGIRKTGTITAAIDERVWTAIVTTSSGNLPSIVDSGGWIKWGDEGTHDYKYSINSTLTGLTGWGNTLGAWSVMRTGDTQIALWNTSGLARTNAPYDVWVTYRK